MCKRGSIVLLNRVKGLTLVLDSSFITCHDQGRRFPREVGRVYSHFLPPSPPLHFSYPIPFLPPLIRSPVLPSLIPFPQPPNPAKESGE